LAPVQKEELSERTPRVEDYLEVISGLIREKGYARPVDISQRLEVTPSTVTSMIQRLDKLGFLVYEKYRGIVLTPKGDELGKGIERRHRVVSRLLEILGLGGDIVYKDAEGIEHHVHPATVDRIEKLVEFFDRNPAIVRSLQRFIQAPED